jgi:hypothetical protein
LVSVGRIKASECDSVVLNNCPATTMTVSCDDSGFVVAIDVKQGGTLEAPSTLKGESFSALPRLSRFTCEGCTALSGTIPAELFRSSLLEVMLTDTGLSGTLPAAALTPANAASLTNLEVSGNGALSGTLPSSIFTLPALSTVRLQRNALSGTIPSTISSPAANGGLNGGGGLQAVSLYGNLFTGSLPLVGMAADATECRIVATQGDSTASVTNLLLCPQQYTSFTAGMGLNALCSRVGYSVDRLCTDAFRQRAGGAGGTNPTPVPLAPSPAVSAPTPRPTLPPGGSVVTNGTATGSDDTGLVIGIVVGGVCLLCSMLVGVCVCLGLTRHTWASSSRNWSSRRHN